MPETTGSTLWAVRLRSRHTGAEITLGMRYATYEEAEVAAKEPCDRCNDAYVVVAAPYRPIEGGNQW